MVKKCNNKVEALREGLGRSISLIYTLTPSLSRSFSLSLTLYILHIKQQQKCPVAKYAIWVPK